MQTGSLPLAPNGKLDFSIKHKCSSLLLWPDKEEPSSKNTILTDPCFTPKGLEIAQEKLESYQFPLDDIQYIFITHGHRDHLPTFILDKAKVKFIKDEPTPLSGITKVPCVGHAPDLESLTFYSNKSESIWIVGDAILNMEWLKAWGYYWPNRYSSKDIIKTWKSVAKIVANADIVIPGHGEAITITARLIQELIDLFPFAKHADKCFSVVPILKKRLEVLKRQEQV